jgi:hypothetical protein
VGRTAVALLAAQRPTLTARVVGGRLAGRAAAPDPAAVPALLQALEALQATSLANPSFVFGDRLTPSLSNPDTNGQLYARENRMDAFARTAQSLTAGWLLEAAQAASLVTVTVDGKALPQSDDGSFNLDVGPGRHTVIATDGAGHQTGLRVVTG